MLYRNHGQPVVAPSAFPGRRNRCTADACRRGSRPGVARRDLGFVMISLDRVTLQRGGRDVVRELSGHLAPGSLTAVAGPNGTGKSTLLLAICGLLPVASGRIALSGIDARSIALLPQEGRLDRSFPITCRDVVALGWTARLGQFPAFRIATHYWAPTAHWPRWVSKVSDRGRSVRCPPDSSSACCSPARSCVMHR